MASSSLLNLDDHPIAGQQGYIILNRDGQVIHDSSSVVVDGDGGVVSTTLQQDAPWLYEMLLSASSLTKEMALTRMTISFDDTSKTRYVVGQDDSHHVYIVQTEEVAVGGTATTSTTTNNSTGTAAIVVDNK